MDELRLAANTLHSLALQECELVTRKKVQRQFYFRIHNIYKLKIAASKGLIAFKFKLFSDNVVTRKTRSSSFRSARK